jgi:hypothetical protein
MKIKHFILSFIFIQFCAHALSCSSNQTLGSADINFVNDLHFNLRNPTVTWFDTSNYIWNELPPEIPAGSTEDAEIGFCCFTPSISTVTINYNMTDPMYNDAIVGHCSFHFEIVCYNDQRAAKMKYYLQTLNSSVCSQHNLTRQNLTGGSISYTIGGIP